MRAKACLGCHGFIYSKNSRCTECGLRYLNRHEMQDTGPNNGNYSLGVMQPFRKVPYGTLSVFGWKEV